MKTVEHLETYWGPKHPITPQDFTRTVEDHVAEVVLEPQMIGPNGKKALGYFEPVAVINDEYGQNAQLYRIRINTQQDPDEQELTFLHEVVHIYLGALIDSVTREKRSVSEFDQYLKKKKNSQKRKLKDFIEDILVWCDKVYKAL